MKKAILLTLFIEYAILSQAQFLFHESFNYPTGTGLIGLGEWIIDGSSTTNPITVNATTPLTHSGYLSSTIGNEISLTSTGQDVSHTFTTQTSGTIYYSFLVNLSSAKSAGDYFIHLVSSSAFIGQVYAKLDGSKIAFGILNATGGTYAPTYTASIYDLATTYLLLVKVDVTTGTSFLIVNPDISAIEPNTGWISSTTPANGGTGGTSVPSASGIGKINLRQGTTSSAPILKLDEIRISTSYNSLITNSTSLPGDISRIRVTDNKLTIPNSTSSSVEIFNTTGAKVQTLKLVNGSAYLYLAKGLYIVRSGNLTTKIRL